MMKKYIAALLSGALLLAPVAFAADSDNMVNNDTTAATQSAPDKNTATKNTEKKKSKCNCCKNHKKKSTQTEKQVPDNQ